MSAFQYATFINVFMALAAILVVAPPLYFLAVPWTIRRHKLLAYLDENSVRLYFRQFFRADGVVKVKASGSFEAVFDARYGRGRFLLPLLLLGVLTVLCAVGGAKTLRVAQHVTYGSHAIPWIAASALAGGFAWAAQDLLGRVRNGDLHPGDLYSAVFRILLAVPFGWSLSCLVKDTVGVPMAFLLGAFPTASLFKFARRIAATRLGLAEDPDTGALDLEKLQSITKTNAERFYDEGVTTIVQLAYADPIDLTLRTNFDFNYVLDCASQALLWIYFGEQTPGLALYSLRGAQEANHLLARLEDPGTREEARALVAKIAAKVNVPPEVLEATLGQVAKDPYTEFICSVWH